MSERFEIRRALRPKDPEAIVALHRRLYTREYGVDSAFVAMVDEAVATAVESGWPRPREAVWIVERDGEFAGCLGLTDDGDDVAVLRWFVLEPQLRGHGLGRQLIAELLATAEANGFRRVRLETFSDLRAAAHLYRAHGFEVTGTETAPRWGRDAITYQHYALDLPRNSPQARAARAVSLS